MAKNFKQGTYIPKNPEKYIHSNSKMNENSKYPVYRSSWELKFFRYCDLKDSIKLWTSEPFGIEYISPLDNRIHRYYPDFFIIYNDKKILIEIKPKSQTLNPKSAYDKQQHAVNMAKWSAAKAVCDSKGIEFLVLTEDEIGMRKGSKKISKTLG